MAKKKPTLGKLPARYSFLLNPYTDVRLSKCPRCQHLTHQRKFPLVIGVKGWGPMVLGKTCRYCTPCELIIAHQDELEAQLAHSFASLAPELVGNEYLVIGTMDRKTWQKGVQSGGYTPEATAEQMADFEHVYDLKVEGGWTKA